MLCKIQCQLVPVALLLGADPSVFSLSTSPGVPKIGANGLFPVLKTDTWSHMAMIGNRMFDQIRRGVQVSTEQV